MATESSNAPEMTVVIMVALLMFFLLGRALYRDMPASAERLLEAGATVANTDWSKCSLDDITSLLDDLPGHPSYFLRDSLDRNTPVLNKHLSAIDSMASACQDLIEDRAKTAAVVAEQSKTLRLLSSQSQ